jgi:hypothetical protein
MRGGAGRWRVWLLIAALVSLAAGCSDDNGDQTLPAVAITAPLNGITVSGQVLIEVTASDAGGILRVLFACDGDELGEDDTPPYSWDWDSAPFADGGNHSLLAAAEDRAGNIAYSEYVVVRVVAP